MKTKSTFTLIIASGALALSACAVGAPLPTSEAKLREATVAAIQGVNPTQIVISNVDRQPAKISWRVTTGTKSYACDSDDSYRLPSCSPEV
ncbi:MAG: hypothetical protein ABMA14_00800 [Hyphomonadaceae bacterium]